jgi:hypothetical protein
MAITLQKAAQNLLNAFAGDTPGWIMPEAKALETALEQFNACTLLAGAPITEANVETAMALWEAALELRDELPALDEAWEEVGTAQFRHTIIAMVPACEKAWEDARETETEHEPYDWEHCPRFLRAQFADDEAPICAQCAGGGVIIDDGKHKICPACDGNCRAPVSLDEASECQTCANATETRSAPCDECGHIDEPGEDDGAVEGQPDGREFMPWWNVITNYSNENGDPRCLQHRVQAGDTTEARELAREAVLRICPAASKFEITASVN